MPDTQLVAVLAAFGLSCNRLAQCSDVAGVCDDKPLGEFEAFLDMACPPDDGSAELQKVDKQNILTAVQLICPFTCDQC